MTLLKSSGSFFEALPKAKTAKVVRTIIDIVAKVPDSTALQVSHSSSSHTPAQLRLSFGCSFGYHLGG